MKSKAKASKTIDPSKVSPEVLRLNPWLKTGVLPSGESVGKDATFSIPVPAPEIVKPETPKRAKKDKRSEAEREFEAHLARRERLGEIKSFRYESMTLVVGDHTCKYTPDFTVFELDGSVTNIEVKGGRTWEDALIKYKAACLIWPCFKWEFWDKTPEGWRQIY
jgi:hypothetical protein